MPPRKSTQQTANANKQLKKENRKLRKQIKRMTPRPPAPTRWRIGYRRQGPMPGYRPYRAPAAFASSGTSYARLGSAGGRPVVYSREYFPVYYTGTATSFLCPATPSVWRPTRTADIVSTFATFRPRRYVIEWKPALGTDTSGMISFGSIWAGTNAPYFTSAEAMTTLPATNGGFTTNIWKPTGRAIRCSTSLRSNNFPLFDLQPDDIPFWIAASVQGNFEAGTLLGYAVIISENFLSNPTMHQEMITYAFCGGEFKHTETPGQPVKTKLRLPIALPLPNLTQGEDYMFYPWKPLEKVLGAANPILKAIVGTYEGDVEEEGVTWRQFEVDSFFATANVLLYLLGTAANFQSVLRS